MNSWHPQTVCHESQKIKRCGLITAYGLAFDDDYLAQITTPDPCGPLHCSRRGIYRLHRSFHRPVGSLGPELEKIHPSVYERVERCGLGYEVKGMLER